MIYFIDPSTVVCGIMGMIAPKYHEDISCKRGLKSYQSLV